jgi:hypothetical protein
MMRRIRRSVRLGNSPHTGLEERVIKVQELKIQGGYVGGYGNSVPAIYEIFGESIGKTT